MARLERLERDAGEFKRSFMRVTEVLLDRSERPGRIEPVLVDHGEQLDRIERVLVDHDDRIDKLGARLSERLDRLIAVTLQERTYHVERLADIERRLSKREQRQGQ